MGDNRLGDWMQTYTGRQFWPLDPRVEDIDILDIAHSLSLQCRFAGHCLRFYSVAEHSVLISRAVPASAGLYGLLHDASEAYLLDVVRPLKPHLPGYREMEQRVTDKIAARFGLPMQMPPEVKAADNRLLLDERDQNMRPTAHVWDLAQAAAGAGVGPLGIPLHYWTPEQAEAEFLMSARAFGVLP